MNYKVVQTGSSGNCIILNEEIMVDCGLSYKKVEPYLKKIKVLLITHTHQDHLNIKTIIRIMKNKPKIKVVGNEEVYKKFDENNIRIIKLGSEENFKYTNKKGYKVDVKPIILYHDVMNYGYRININDLLDDIKIFYATDTCTLKGIEAKNYDYYFVETNYCEDKIMEISKYKKENDLFDDSQRVIDTHLSRQEAEDFYIKNKKDSSEFIPLHKSSRNY